MGNEMSNENTPQLYGVFGGPTMVASHSNKLSQVFVESEKFVCAEGMCLPFLMPAEQKAGGSCCISKSSFCTLFLVLSLFMSCWYCNKGCNFVVGQLVVTLLIHGDSEGNMLIANLQTVKSSQTLRKKIMNTN